MSCALDRRLVELRCGSPTPLHLLGFKLVNGDYRQAKALEKKRTAIRDKRN
jgi:hypothetical protein